jgi:hypothetical protein
MAVIIQIRRGTAAQWTTANTILADGEMGYEKDTSKFKFGDGTTAWNSLDYIETGGGDAHFLGKYISLAALETAHATAADGDYAIVDAGAGTDAKIYIWDADEGWVEGGGTGASTFADLTGSPNDNAALDAALDAKQDALGFTPENTTNKATNLTSPDNIKYPTTQAVSTALAGKQNTIGFTPEDVSNKSSNLTSPDNTKYPTTQAVATALSGKQNSLGFTPENVANKDQNSGYAGLDSTGNVTKVWTTVLTGLSLVTGGVIAATDTILAAFGKLQKQISDLATTVGNIVVPVKASQVETDAGTDDAKFVTPLKWFGKAKAKTTTAAAFAVDATNDLKTIIATPAGAINATINAATTDVMVTVLNTGSANITFVSGTATFTGIQTLTPGKGAVIRYLTSTTAVVVGGGSIAFASVTAKPTTVAGYGIIDTLRRILSLFTTTNNVTTGETTLGTIPTDGISTDGSFIQFEVSGRISATAGTKKLKVKYGGVTVFDSGDMAISTATNYHIRGIIMRTAAGTQKTSGTIITSSTVTGFCDYKATTVDNSVAQDLIVTGQAGATNDIYCEFFIANKVGV